MPTFYEVLGVPRTATDEQIRARHRALARKLHPDVNPSPQAHARFIEIQKAYDTLSDPQRRREYDRTFPHIPQARGCGSGTTWHEPEERRRPEWLHPEKDYRALSDSEMAREGCVVVLVVVLLLAIFLVLWFADQSAY